MPSTKRPTKTFNEEADEDDYSDTGFSRLYKQALWHDNKMRSSFLYQLDGLLESRGFEVNRRSISQSISQNAERDIGKACGLISNRDRQEDIDPEFARLYGPYLLTLG